MFFFDSLHFFPRDENGSLSSEDAVEDTLGNHASTGFEDGRHEDFDRKHGKPKLVNERKAKLLKANVSPFGLTHSLAASRTVGVIQIQTDRNGSYDYVLTAV